MTTINMNGTDLVRANRISVQKEDTNLVARFYKTHDKVAEISHTNTQWFEDEKMNSTANKELFRLYMIKNASEFGIQYDAQDRRAEDNMFPKRYDSDSLLREWSAKIVRRDLETWSAKFNGLIENITAEDIIPMDVSPKGKEVSAVYGNGAWAWATIKVTAVVVVGEEVAYPTMEVQLVSGQLKKPSIINTQGEETQSYCYTGFMNVVAEDIPSIKTKEEIPADAQ